MILIQNEPAPEQLALDFFQENIFLDSQLYKNPCIEEDPDCFFLGSLMPEKFIGEKFLEDYTIFANSKADKYPQNNSSPDTFELKIDGQELYDRKTRIAARVNEYLNSNSSISSLELQIRKPFVQAKKNYDPSNDKSIYLEVSKSIFTGQEYYVEVDLYTNYKGEFQFTESFGYRFIFDKNMNLIDWDTVY